MRRRRVLSSSLSGCPVHGLRALAHELELDRHNGLLVAFNGAQVRDASTGEVLYDQAIPADLAREVLVHMKKFEVIPMLVDGDTPASILRMRITAPSTAAASPRT